MGELVDRDQEHLRLLKWGFYVMAGVSALFSLFSLVYIGMGGLFASGAIPTKQGPADDPRTVGLIFLFLGIGLLLVGIAATFLNYFVGRSLGERRRRIFCMVVAGLWCISVPFGTALGVATIVVLNRPSVQALFDGPGSPPAGPPALAA